MLLGGVLTQTISLMLLMGVSGIDEGFDLFFSTNLDEMSDIPIHFEKPLPTWLKGTLVSAFLYM